MYWCSLFILPGAVVKKLEKIMKNFLWGGNLDKAHAKVAWEDVCFPKDEGGLGIRKLKVWNQALMTNHIQNLCSKKDSLWIK